MHLYGTILVIDDDAGIRGLLRNFLSKTGYSVITASDPDTGMKRLKQNNFDLVITDLIMPAMSGIDLLKNIRVHDPNMPVVVITAYPSIETVVMVMKEGASDFIIKPFNFDRVSLVVKSTIEEGRLKKKNRLLKYRTRKADNVEHINKNLQDKVKELSALYAISEALHYHFTTIVELFEKVIEIAVSITEVTKAGLWVLDGKDKEILLQANKGLKNSIGNRVSLIDAPLVSKVFREKRLYLSQNLKTCVCGFNDTGFKHPFLAIPILIGNEVFAVLHLCHKIGGTNFTGSDISLVTSLTQKASLTIENLALHENLIENVAHSITSLVKAIDARDNYTMNHCKRVTSYAVRLAQYIGCEDMLDALRFAGPIHDVGKIGVRDAILLKPGALDPFERDIMQNHVTIGDEIVKPLNLGHSELAVVRNHHERFDGTGYPDRLKGDEIALTARIFSVVDAYDAMSTDRPYKSAMSHEDSIAELIKCSGTQLDGDIVDVFIKYGICTGEVKTIGHL
ncbi:MAG: response regulator [Thermodesulfobacteriota bacterium]